MEKVLLIIIERKRTKKYLLKETTQEMIKLVDSCGGTVVEICTALIDRPTPAYYIRSGKIQEIKDIVYDVKPDLLVFSIDLSPTQKRNFERLFKLRIIDRTALILDIFAYHASTREGKMQIELAQLIYTLPRLSEIWEKFSRLGGGIGTRGPGEQKIEVDRRKIRSKIAKIKKELQKIRAHRGRVRYQRRRNHVQVISLIGYTNVGKSTLLNSMTGATVFAQDKLFATLDPTTRRVFIPGLQKEVLITDTVGFLNDLPHTLIEAFKATLEEIRDADLIIEVIDISDEFYIDKERAVRTVLKEIEADHIPRLRVLNKVDLVSDAQKKRITRKFDPAVLVSAKTGTGLEELKEEIARRIVDEYTDKDN